MTLMNQLPHDCEVYRGQEQPNTYLHAGAGNKGWPHDHSTEDTYEVPPFTYMNGIVVKKQPTPSTEDREYTAEFRSDGGAVLVLRINQTIASFQTFTDAQIAAKALNELKGY